MVDTAQNGDVIEFCGDAQRLLTLLDQLAKITNLWEQAPEGMCAHCGGDVYTEAEMEEMKPDPEDWGDSYKNSVPIHWDEQKGEWVEGEKPDHQHPNPEEAE